MRVPDLPGCHGGGPNPETAIADAISALAECAGELQKRKEALPQPRTLKQILADPAQRPDAQHGETAVMLPLLLSKHPQLSALVGAARSCRCQTEVDEYVRQLRDEWEI